MGICIIKIGWKVVCENREYGVIMLSFMMVLIMFIGIVYCMCQVLFNRRVVCKVFIIIILIVFFCIVLFVLKIYDLVEVIEYVYVYNKDKELVFWLWFIYEILFCLMEFGLVCIVIYVVLFFRFFKKCLFGCSWCCFELGMDEIIVSRGEYWERIGINQMISFGFFIEIVGNNNV